MDKIVKASDLINFIEANNLQDFELVFKFTDGFNTFPNVRSFAGLAISDIGHSSKRIIISGDEE